MEELHAKMHEHYKNLKKRKLSEEVANLKSRESEIQNYQQSVEDLLETLRMDNERLFNEMFTLEEKHAESEKVVFEQAWKIKDLSRELARLKELLAKKDEEQKLLAKKDEELAEANQIVTPVKSPQIMTPVKSPQIVTPVKSPQIVALVNSPHSQYNTRSRSKSVRFEEKSHKKNADPIVQHEIVTVTPPSRKRTLDNKVDEMAKDSISYVCTLFENVIGMRISIESQSKEESCFSFTHEKSGYSFNLTWSRNGGILMYKVSSLGSLENIALEWMKEEIIFGMNMYRAFFDRLTSVLPRG